MAGPAASGRIRPPRRLRQERDDDGSRPSPPESVTRRLVPSTGSHALVAEYFAPAPVMSDAPRPNFFVIGAMKSGTTSLHQYLASHPDVFMPAEKEIKFFVEAKNWRNGLDWYLAHFASAGSASAVGEASPQYAMAHCFPGVPRRMLQVAPDARVVYVVREPVARLRSHYLHAVAEGRESLPIAEAVRRDPGYLQTSRYAMQLDAYLDHVPADRIFVVTSDSLRDDRRAAVARIFAFLGVDPTWAPPNLDDESHRTEDKFTSRGGRRSFVPRRRVADLPDATLSPDDVAVLREKFRPQVEPLRAWLGADWDGWGLLGPTA
jgi:hypothetical protein